MFPYLWGYGVMFNKMENINSEIVRDAILDQIVREAGISFLSDENLKKRENERISLKSSLERVSQLKDKSSLARQTGTELEENLSDLNLE